MEDEGEAMEDLTGDRYREGGKEMSFDFEDDRGGMVMTEETSEEGVQVDGESGEEEGEEDNEDVEMNDDQSGDENDEQDEEEPEASLTPELIIPKKRGPGRPPKNGVISQRALALAKKKAQEKAKKAIAPPMPPKKNKVGRPRKHPRPETPPRQEKRKYTKRKGKEAELEPANGENARPAKPLKPPRRATSPSPVFDESTLTD